MGMYTGLRGKVKLKPEVAKLMPNAYDDNIWHYIAIQLLNNKILTFSDDTRSDFIPFGSICYMPDDWIHNHTIVDCVWEFCCSLKNYSGTIHAFIELLPEIAVAWDLEERYEEWYESVFHKHGELK